LNEKKYLHLSYEFPCDCLVNSKMLLILRPIDLLAGTPGTAV